MKKNGIKSVLFSAVFACVLGATANVSAQTAPPTVVSSTPKINYVVLGRDFEKYPKPKRKTPQNKHRIEVIYFYYLGSPWSAQIDQKMRRWAATRPYDLSFTAVPVFFEDQQSGVFAARIHYALVALKEDERLIPLLMDAVHKGHVNLARTESVISWMDSHGIPRKDFLKALNLPQNKFQTTSIPFAMDEYGVKSAPTIVIEGKYLISSTENRSPSRVMAVAQFMADKLSLGGSAP